METIAHTPPVSHEIESHPNTGRARRFHRSWTLPAGNRRHILDEYCTSSTARREKLTSTPLMQVMKYLVPPMLAVGSLKFQANPDSLFGENPVPVWCFLVATYIYWLIVASREQITTRHPNWFKALNNAALASSLLSILSLVSIFISYPFSLVPLIIWIPLPLVLNLPLLYNAYAWLKRGAIIVVDKVQSTIAMARGVDSIEGVNLPV